MAKARPPTIRDIAARLGLSTSTVSTALTGQLNGTFVSAETRELVQRTARELGYPMERLRAARRSPRRVAVTCPEARHALYYGTALEVVRLLGQQDCQAILSMLPTCEAACAEAVSLYARHVVDAAIFVGFRVQSPDLSDPDLPYVAIGDMPDDAQVWRVGIDNAAGGRLVGDHLWGLGHRRVGWIGMAASPVVSERRLAGLRAAWEAQGEQLPDRWALSLDPDSRLEAARDPETGLPGWLERLARRGETLTALFCFNDILAAGVIRILRRQGISVPGEISVVGFDDMMFTEWIDPPLTTVRQSFMEMGQAAVELLNERLSEPAAEPRQRILDCELVVRASTTQAPLGP